MNMRFVFSFLVSILVGFQSIQPVSAGLSIDPNDPNIRGRLWPNATIPYVIQDGFTAEGRANLMTAMKEFNTKTVIKFIPRTQQEHYLVFSPWDSINAGCAIGMQLGPQELKIHRGAWVGTAVHELGHAVGLYHEHNRPDVEQYFAFRGNESNLYCKDVYLKTKDFDAVLQGSYDYLSVMNYFTGCVISKTPAIARTRAPYSVDYYNSLYIWGKNGFKLGTNLSAGDIAAIAKLYAHPPVRQDWDYTSCVDHPHPDAPNQCRYLQESGACTAYSHQEVVYRSCAATCGLCKSTGSPGNPPDNGGGDDDGGNDGDDGLCKDQRAGDFCMFGATINLCSESEDFKSQCRKSCGCDGSPIPTVMKDANGVSDNQNCRYWAARMCKDTLFVQRACPASCSTYEKYRSEFDRMSK